MAEAKKPSSKKKAVSSKTKPASKPAKKVEEQDGSIKKSTTTTSKANIQEKVAADKQDVKSKKQKTKDTAAETVEVADNVDLKDKSKSVAEDKKDASDSPAKPLAKSGKRSAKALKELEEKEAKASRKAAQSSEASSEGGKSATAKHKPRTAEDKLKARGKRYREAVKSIDKSKQYGLKEAVQLTTQASKVKFDATVELHIRLRVDPKQADQNIRDMVVLPAGTGKTVRVAVFCGEDDVSKAKKAGADIAAADEFLQLLEKNELNFDVLIATPAVMQKLGKFARVLGPKGLMPNPKSGTVTTDVAKAIQEAKAGRVEYRVDSYGIVHVGIGKVSFGADKLFDNARAIVESIKANKPASVKGAYVHTAFVTTTMGPSVAIDVSEISSL